MLLLRVIIFGIFLSFAGSQLCDFGAVYAKNNGVEKAEQNRKKKKTSGKKPKTKTSFGRAYSNALKKGLPVFTWNGKKYSTGKTGKGNLTRKSKNHNSASYNNVSFGSAYKDAKRKGFPTFTWNGKKYTTGKKGKTLKTKYTKKRKNSKYSSKKKKTKKYSKKRNTKRKKTVKRRKYNTGYYAPRTYTPPKSYDNNDSKGREYKRESSNYNAPLKKEPKKE